MKLLLFLAIIKRTYFKVVMTKVWVEYFFFLELYRLELVENFRKYFLKALIVGSSMWVGAIVVVGKSWHNSCGCSRKWCMQLWIIIHFFLWKMIFCIDCCNNHFVKYFEILHWLNLHQFYNQCRMCNTLKYC